MTDEAIIVCIKYNKANSGEHYYSPNLSWNLHPRNFMLDLFPR